jgi:hypothetical protein
MTPAVAWGGTANFRKIRGDTAAQTQDQFTTLGKPTRMVIVAVKAGTNASSALTT